MAGYVYGKGAWKVVLWRKAMKVSTEGDGTRSLCAAIAVLKSWLGDAGGLVASGVGNTTEGTIQGWAIGKRA